MASLNNCTRSESYKTTCTTGLGQCTRHRTVTYSCWNWPGDGNIVKCTDNNKVYRFNNGDKRLYLIDDPNIRDQYGITTFWRENGGNSNCIDGNWGSQTSAGNRPIFKPTTSIDVAPEGATVKCYDKNPDDIYRWTNNKLIKYPSEQVSVVDSWDTNWRNYKAYDCGTKTISAGTMQTKPTDGATIKCLDDKNYYRYVLSENKLYKYENETIATQYGGTLPIIESNCDQYQSSRGSFTTWQTLTNTEADDKSVRCYDKGTGTDLYRWTNGTLIKYPNDTVARSWDNAWNNYKGYNCGTVPISTQEMQTKPPDETAIKCTDDGNKLYKYNASNNTLSFYPNVSTFKQYNPTWNGEILDRNCQQYSKTKGTFTATIPFINTATEGESVACNQNNVNTSSTNIYRYIKSNDLLSSYNSSDTIGLSWNTNWKNYNSYTCDTKYTQNVNNLVKKHISNDVIQCDHDNGWYVYTPEDNSITKYPSRAVIQQYIPTYDGQTSTRENCSSYKINNNLLGQLMPADNTTVRFNGETSYHIFKDGKTHQYPNTSIALLNDPDYASTGNTPRNILDKQLTNIGAPVKWPLQNYDIVSCNTTSGYNSTDIYSYKAGTGTDPGTITKYPGQNVPSEKTKMNTWISNLPVNPYYNCDKVFRETTMNSNVPYPTKTDLIQCLNRTDENTYRNYNVSGNYSGNRPPVNSSSKYFKLNQNTNKFERYGNEDVVKTYYPNYTTVAKSFDDCYMLNREMEDTVIMYPEPKDKTIIKCTNQEQSSFPYYKYDSSNKSLNKYPISGVAERLDPSYLSRAVNYNCSYLSLTNPGTVFNYSVPNGGTIINCSNEPKSTFPYYQYDNSLNQLRKFPTEHVLKTWYNSYQPQSYDCSYLPVNKGVNFSYKVADGSTINCSNKNNESFPYYKFNSGTQSLNRYKDITSLFTWAPWNTNLTTNSIVNVSTLDCNYISQQYGSVIDNKPISDNTFITCSNDNNNKLYAYSNMLIRPFNDSTIVSWNASVQNVANCDSFTKGPPLYEKNMENLHSYMNSPFLETNRNGEKSYFILNNNDNSCNPIPNNYNPVTNNSTDSDKFYSRDKFIQLFTDDRCTNIANNNSAVSYSTVNNFKVGTLKYVSGQNSDYYKLTTLNTR